MTLSRRHIDQLAGALRRKAVDLSGRRVLIAKIKGSAQEPDLTLPTNCSGFGRVHHFKRLPCEKWAEDPLPLDPATDAMGLPTTDLIQAEVFQIAVCSWHCWYCFVPRSLLCAEDANSEWFSPSALFDMFQELENKPPVIDLSGGQPDLVPEWVLWMIEEAERRGLQRKVFLWSDDSLSTDYFFKYLSDSQISRIAACRSYARVGCFKGFDPESFSYNTGASPALYRKQFEIMSGLIAAGLDMYGYCTLTTPHVRNLESRMKHFLDDLQGVHPLLPLRTVPLKILPFSPTRARSRFDGREPSMQSQWTALEHWFNEQRRRYTTTQREKRITEHHLRSGGRYHV